MASVPQFICPLRYAWGLVNPRVPFPPSLEVAGRRNPDEPERDPVKEGARRERARAAVRRYQARARGVQPPPDPEATAREAARQERNRTYQREYARRRRARSQQAA